VLVRWWTDTRPLCEATAPALRALERAYRGRDFVVLGRLPPEAPGDHSVARMQRAAGPSSSIFRSP
jgi:hypothetical protein